MKAQEFIVESVSPVVYHYTSITNALDILESGEFQLSGALGSIEEKSLPRGHYYYLSTARTRHGGYHDVVGSSGVLFVLDGTWFNQRYRSAPYDYWQNRTPGIIHHKGHEAEDRIFSREPTIPIDGVKAVHVLVKPDAENLHRLWARRTLLAAKRRNIPAFLYNDAKHWRNMDQRNTIGVQALSGQLGEPSGYHSRRRKYMAPWLELIHADRKSALSRDADRIRYGLQYTYDKQNAIQGLSNDLANARKPRSGPDRQIAVKIIAFMRKHNLSKVSELVNFLADKWKNKDISESLHQNFGDELPEQDLGENFADGRNPGRRGLAKRMGVPTKASVSRLRKIAKSSSGEKQRMAHWMANMKAGKAKKS